MSDIDKCFRQTDLCDQNCTNTPGEHNTVSDLTISDSTVSDSTVSDLTVNDLDTPVMQLTQLHVSVQLRVRRGW